MRRRLYFLLPDLAIAHTVVDELLLARIDDHHIHIVAKEGTDMGDLPEAGILEKSDLVHALELGVGVGGATGVLAGLIAMTFPPAGLVLGGGAVLGTALAGAGFGAWVSGMIGTSVPNSRIKDYEKAIEAGELLVMVDAPKDQVDEISTMIQRHHPEVEIGGTEPIMPAFP